MRSIVDRAFLNITPSPVSITWSFAPWDMAYFSRNSLGIVVWPFRVTVTVVNPDSDQVWFG